MDPTLNEVLNGVFRWIHVVAGVVWIGHLYFFNFVNAQVAKTYDADSKKKVVPELMPRALYWFRWGAAYTWISGILLLGLVIYMGGVTMRDAAGTSWPISKGIEAAIGIGSLVVGFLIYDILWKAVGKNEQAGAIVSFLLLVGVAFGYSRIFPGRSAAIHLGALLGTIMASNVWMRIWPSQRKIIAAIKQGQAPDAALVALAGLRSKHNTYMSVPLILFMVSNHFSVAYGHRFAWAINAAILLVGFLATKALYLKSGGPAPARFMPASTTAAPDRSADSAQK